jgi:hypothetical protein
VNEAAMADAHMQLAQRKGWRELAGGFPLAEGLDHLEFLGLAELKLVLCLRPVKTNWCVRLYQRMLRPWVNVTPRFELCPDQETAAGTVQVTITITRGRDGRTQVTTEPDISTLENINVAGITA